MLDLSGRTVVIVGGGAVGARKARGLLEAGAGRIRVISPTFCDEVPAAVEQVTRRYEAGDLAGATLAFAATDDPAVNAAVVREAKERGVLVNRADSDETEPGDFTTPAVMRTGDLLVTVSAGGSPALAAVVRDGLAARVEPRWVAMAAAMRELRPRILASHAPIEWRRNALRDLLDEEAMEIAAGGDVEALWLWVKERNRGI